MNYFPNIDQPKVKAYYQKEQTQQKHSRHYADRELRRAAAISAAANSKPSNDGKVVSGIKKCCKTIPGIRTMYAMAACYKDNGWDYTRNYFFGSPARSGSKGIGINAADRKDLVVLESGFTIEAEPSEAAAAQQRSERFANPVKISILTPLYNTPLNFLHEMIDSVTGQTYENWELCLSDCSDGREAEEIRRICTEYAEKDSRIRYQKADHQMGISENTNACIAMSSGDYFALLDHDDILHKSAMYELARAVNEQNADFIYSDEAKFEQDIHKCYAPNFKPDFAPDELRAHNYICHLTAFSRKLLGQCGLYRPECDGSQDHDMVLRLTEQAEHIVHLPKVLYFWRVHSNSVSAGIDTKLYAINAAKKAVMDQIQRKGIPVDGEVENIPPFPSLYRVPYHVDPELSVTVLIWNAVRQDEVRECILRLDKHQIWHSVNIVIACTEDKKEKMEELITRAVTVWPVSVRTEPISQILPDIQSDLILFAESKTYVDSKDWLQEMSAYAMREDTGLVGGKIWNTDETCCDVGSALMADGSVRKLLPMASRHHWGYEAMLHHPRNASIVPGMFMMMKTKDLEYLHSTDPDMGNCWAEDLCLRERLNGRVNVLTPFVVCTRSEKIKEPNSSQKFTDTYRGLYENDPYLNPNLKDLICRRG